MTKNTIDIPQLPFWLLRLAAQPTVRQRMMRNPVLFAAWYAPIADIISWSKEVQSIQEAERKKKLSLERMSSLLSKVNYAVEGGSRDVDYMRRILEGVAVHPWAAENQEDFADLVDECLAKFESIYDELLSLDRTRFTARVRELADVLELDALGRDVLSFAIACSASVELHTLFGQLERSTTPLPAEVFSEMLKTSPAQLRGVLGSTSALHLSGLLRTEGRVNRYPVVSPFWVRVLVEATEGLAAALAEPMKFRATSGVPARLPAEDLELAARVLTTERGAKGVNLLLYGAANLDKQTVLRSLVKATGRTAYQLTRLEDAWGQTAAHAYIAQRALAKEQPDSLLVVDRPAEILDAQPSQFLASLFGLDLDRSDVAPFDELMLTANPLPTVWLAGSTSTLNPDTVARFIFHAGLQKARREDRRTQLEELVSTLDLASETKKALLRLEDTSAVQLQTALRAAELSGATTAEAREAALVQAVKRSLTAMSRAVQPKTKESVTEYSLRFLNCSGRFGPKEILQSLRKRGKGTLCVYGLPGTGKTQYVEYIAEALGKPLVAKRASDLLSKWVGESEQKIAALFEEAASEDAIAFLDEGDSFLRNRMTARESWEVTRVNELLQQMERFDGIFVVSTNLFKGLDMAAMRRFTFKLEFLPLSAEQRWEMFANEVLRRRNRAEIAAHKAEWFERLVLMRDLCAGDFATVKRQCILLEKRLRPDEWLEQLEIECRVKRGDDDPDVSGR